MFAGWDVQTDSTANNEACHAVGESHDMGFVFWLDEGEKFVQFHGLHLIGQGAGGS